MRLRTMALALCWLSHPLPATAQSEPDAGAADTGAASTNAAIAAENTGDLGPVLGSDYGAVATATRSPRLARTVPATATVLRRPDIDQSPALTMDGVLRSVPSVQTFRRSPSLTADPSAMGLNLRGVGPSGISRTLVLVDGVPVNDPFGGSIYWRSLPKLGIDRVEVVPGGGSALYGSSALAGVVQLFSRPLSRSFEADAAYGSFNTLQLDARGAYTLGQVGASVEGEYLRSDGYRVVAANQAGPIDGPAGSSHLSLNARTTVRATDRLSFTGALRLFHEAQSGGTRYTSSEVEQGVLSLQSDLQLERDAQLSVLLFGRLQRFQQDRARIDNSRSAESLAAHQDVPADEQGVSLIYRSPALRAGGTHNLSAGLDARRVHGTSREHLMQNALVERDSGGEQLLSGVFLQDLYTVNRKFELDGALRADLWRNAQGRSQLGYQDDTAQTTLFRARNAYALSPRVGALVRALDWLSLRASLYRAFRAPTLSELYRPFQVGTILTAANAALGPELLHGFEGGVELAPLAGMTLRATGFWNRLDQPISNVTLATPLSDGSMRMRQNLGHARVRGLEASVEQRIGWFSGVLAYTLAASQVRDGGSVQGLRGKRLAQDPVHRASAQLRFDRPDWFSAALSVRVSSSQYEDDLNTLRLKPFAVVDLSASRRLFWRLEAFVAVENLLDTTYLVGRAGVDTVGPPLLARGGLRIRDR